MPKTRGGSTTAPQSSQRAAPVRAPLDAPSHLPDSAPQSRYHTRKASATSVAPPQIPLRSPPTKKAKTSEPREFSTAPRDSQSQPSSAKRPRPSLPIEGNSDCRSRDFHVEAYSITLLCDSSLSCGIHTAYLREDHFEERASPEMLLVDVVLRANLFPLQHKVQRLGAIMEALFRISEGYYFGLHHLIMAALLHFEEKTLVQSPAAIVERASLLTNGLRYGSIASPQNFPSQGKSLLLRPLQTLPQPVPEATSSDAPPVVPPTSEPPITIPGPEYRTLLASFQTLTTTQTAIMERMDHFQLQQDQQTLILREIQHHLGLSPPAPPVAVPSTVAVEDPSYPPEEPTT
ncbi:hypothetical protein CK203_076124 [Vitis vinifera]|uniref:Uncharacterized protein n=1 Tax=Vitis vinifera TaxID=29760 RepID=A0A438ELW9_VITVI|nr:hypothetical protein CK203_076124 [Vitis vinifera]